MIDWNSPTELKRTIQETGLPISTFAERAGVSKAQLHRLLAGKFKPSFRTRESIEATLAALRGSHACQGGRA